MTLLDRLKPEYHEKLNDECIKILSNNKYYIDLSVLDAQIICLHIIGESLDLHNLTELFNQIKVRNL